MEMVLGHGNESVSKIINGARAQAAFDQAKLEEELKDKIRKDMENKIAQDEIKLRIQRSAEQNQQRIQKMKQVNGMIEDLYHATIIELHKHLQGNPKIYKTLVNNLII
jgi:stress-induced morphogen